MSNSPPVTMASLEAERWNNIILFYLSASLPWSKQVLS